MPNCDFYAVQSDHEQLLKWLFHEGTCEVFELSSDFEQPLKRFRSAGEVMTQFERTYDTGEKWRDVYLQLYVSGAGPPFVPRRIELNPKACNGATFRYAAEGWGLVQLYLGSVTDRGVKDSHSNHNSQKRAEAWASSLSDRQEVDKWDFKKITAFSSRLNREVKKLSVAKIGSRPVLPGALKLWQEGLSPGKSHVGFGFRTNDCLSPFFVKGVGISTQRLTKERGDDSWTGWHNLQTF